MKLGGAISVPCGVAAAYVGSVHNGLPSPMPSAKRRIANRVAYSLLTQSSVRSSVPMSGSASSLASHRLNVPRAKLRL